MTRLQALEALLEKVEAGEIPDHGTVNRALMTEALRDLGFPLRQLVQWIMDPTDIRGMGAAKALHEAVLEGWDFDIDSGTGVCVYKDNLSEVETGHADNPSPAWLIAILKALIEKEKGYD